MDAHSIALLQQSVYDTDSVHDTFDDVIDNGSVYVGITKQGGENVLAFRGSVTGTDWLHDFEAIPIAIEHVGTVHEGFWQGVVDAFNQLDIHAGDAVSIIGHSLGCAHAAYTARLCLLRGVAVKQLYLLAPPRMGYQDFHDGLRNVADLRAWHNGYDPVPDVPITTEDMPWVQFDMEKIEQPPQGLDSLVPTEWHNISLYVKGIE